MTEALLTPIALSKLKKSRSVALENLKFYECLYDGLDESSERETIGQAMAQKQSYIGAVAAILKNHEVIVSDSPAAAPSGVDKETSAEIETGEHLIQEEHFTSAIKSCLADIDDKLTIELLSDHLNAAEIAVSTIKSTSLKI